MSDQFLQQLEKGALTAAEKVNAMVVRTVDDYTGAAEFKKFLKARQKEVDEAFDPIVKRNYDAWKEAKAQKDKYLKPFVDVEAVLDVKMKQFIREDNERREKEQAKLDEQRRKEAEKLQARADKAAEKGNTERAAQLQEQADQTRVTAPVAASSVPKVAGVAPKKIWKFRITDENKIPRDYLVPDQVKIGAFVRAMKKKGEVIPGVEAYEDLAI